MNIVITFAIIGRQINILYNGKNIYGKCNKGKECHMYNYIVLFTDSSDTKQKVAFQFND